MPDVAARGRQIILNGENLHDTLRALSRLAEETIPDAVAGYTLVDPSHSFIKESVFPSLPAIFQDSIAAVPLFERVVGTCTESLRNRVPVISNDILADTQFDMNWRDLCLRCGLKSVQSIPICDRDGVPEGTFVLGYRHPASDADWDSATMATFANLAGEAIRLYRTLAVPGSTRAALLAG